MDDRLLRALGRHQREDLDAPEQPAAADDRWRDAEQPIADDERERMLDAVFEAVDAPVESEAAAVPVIDLAAARRRRAMIGVVLGLAAALGVLAFGWRELGSRRDLGGSRLPEYATTRLHGGRASQRGDTPEPSVALTLVASDEIDWIVTPDEPIHTEVDLALLAEPVQGEPVLVRGVEARVSESGVVRLHGRLHDFVALSPGIWTLTLLIAEPGELPADVAEARTSEAERWRVASVRLTVESGP